MTAKNEEARLQLFQESKSLEIILSVLKSYLEADFKVRKTWAALCKVLQTENCVLGNRTLPIKSRQPAIFVVITFFYLNLGPKELPIFVVTHSTFIFLLVLTMKFKYISL